MAEPAPQDNDYNEYRTRGGGQRRKMDEADVKLALEMYEDGVSVREMCDYFGVAVSTFYTYIRLHLKPRSD